MPVTATSTLSELAWVFLRLGATAFGGPAAHIALMEAEVVRRRRWLTREQFLDYLGATNLIPGPNSTELAIHIGFSRGGWPGLVTAGVSFILPAAAIVTVIAWAYVRYGALPQVAGILAAVTPVVIAVVAHALVALGRAAVKSTWLAAVGVLAVAAIAAGVHELIVLLAAGLACGTATSIGRRVAAIGAVALASAVPASALAAVGATAAAPFTLTTLFVVFAKIGSVLFGSGYVLLAFLRADFVDRLGWLTERQLLDAVAVGQITPGPVLTTATFIGYVLGGTPGAAVATLAIFLPAFLFVAASGPIVPRLRRSRFASAALDGVNVASLALMAIVTWHLARTTLASPLPAVICAASLVALVRYNVNPTVPIVIAAIIGWMISS